MMLSCDDVARYFLARADDDASGELISNLKLQKLVYYAQGFSLALFDRPLFGESIVAWQHGPVVPALYFEYQKYGAGPIPPPDDLDWKKYSGEIRDLLDEVYTVYGQFSAWKLREMTHREPPWQNTVSRMEISHESLREYFLTQIHE